MSIPDDLDVSEPTMAELAAARALSRDLDHLARDVEAASDRFSDDDSRVVRDARERMASARGDLDRAALDVAVSAAALAEQRAAGDRWLRDAPKRVDLESATAEVAAARSALMAAANAGGPTAAADVRLRAARQHLRELEDRRAAADRDYETACQQAKSRLDRQGKCKTAGHDPLVLDSGSVPDLPGTPRSPLPRPGIAAPPPTRIASTPPAAAPAPAPPTVSASTVPAMPTVPANAALPAPMAPAAMQAPMPAMPQVPSTAPASAPRRDTDRPAVDTPELAGLLAAGTAPAAATPRPAAAVPAPVAAPAPVPVATNPGYSANGLSAAAELSGRPTPSPGAFAAPTGLSASHAAQQIHGGAGTEASTRTGTAPMSGPMMPGVGGMPAGNGGGAAREGARIERHSPLGMETLAEAVPGGTICQKRDEKKVS